MSISRGTDGRHVVMAFTGHSHFLLLLCCVMKNNYGVIIVCYALSNLCVTHLAGLRYSSSCRNQLMHIPNCKSSVQVH